MYCVELDMWQSLTGVIVVPFSAVSEKVLASLGDLQERMLMKERALSSESTHSPCTHLVTV